MPWKETCAMDERMAFVLEAMKGETSLSEVCRFYGISRKTGYKWLARFAERGRAGLVDASHVAHHCPHRVSEKVGNAIVEVRRRHPSWGPKKIWGWLEDHRPSLALPALSTIGELLRAKGLTVARRRRMRVPLSVPFGSCTQPNDVWTVDFKGWFRTADGSRCDPLTLKDAHSRYLLRCQAVERTDSESVWPIFDAAFREFGLPLRMRSDNGSPFASCGAGGLTRLSIRFVKAGITPERIEPGKPQQNGRHERFHGTLKKETADPPAANLKQQQRRFDVFRKLYNEERPHEALGQRPPARYYAASDRRYSGRLREPEYAGDLEVRRVRANGDIKWRGGFVYVNQALAGEPIGCEETEDGSFMLRYGPIELGKLDSNGRLCVPRRRGTHNRPPS